MVESCFGKIVGADSIINLRQMLRFSIMSLLLHTPKIMIEFIWNIYKHPRRGTYIEET